MSEESIAIIDTDFIKYAVASAGEKRSIIVYKDDLPHGEFDTRTQFRQHCAEYNLEYDDYEIRDQQIPEPLSNVLHSAKLMMQSAIKASGCKDYKAYIGKGDSFRVERSTLLKYKGNREGSLRPVWLKEVEEYLVKRFGAVYVEGIEADDQAVMDCFGTDNILVGLDKDFFGSPVRFLNMNKQEEGIIDCRGFGSLWRDEKGKVSGKGRMFFYLQVASGDKADNYCANCVSEIRWGEISAYNKLKDCTTDREALQAVVDIYKYLYPEPKVVTGWRGDEIEIDWLYVMSECFDLARMLRWENDVVVLKDILDKMGIDHGT